MGIDEDDESLIQLIQLQTLSNGCDLCKKSALNKNKGSDPWLFGIIFVTIINMSSLVGALVIPCNNKKFYQKILMFLIALAVGTLAGSGLIHLIPEVCIFYDQPSILLFSIY